jgi:hypothetical protein
LDAWQIVTDALVMNTFAHNTRRISRQLTSAQGHDSNGGPVTGLARRLAAWWSDDSMSATFSVERERDQRMLRRQSGRW